MPSSSATTASTQFLAFTDHDKRLQWIASVEQVEQLNPWIVIAGHKDADTRDDNPAAIPGGAKAYIRDFDQALSRNRSAQAPRGWSTR